MYLLFRLLLRSERLFPGGAAFDRCQSCGRRRGGHADAEMAAEASAWCVPARPAVRRGCGADSPSVCSQVEAIMATIVSIVEGWARGRPRSPGVCKPSRTCGETSTPPLYTYFASLDFACRAQDTTSCLMRRRSTPTASDAWPPFSSTSAPARTTFWTYDSEPWRGWLRVRGRSGGRSMRRAEAAERAIHRDRTP